MNIFITQSKPSEAKFYEHVDIAFWNRFQYIQSKSTAEVFSIDVDGDCNIVAEPLCVEHTLEVLGVDYPEGIPEGLLSTKVKLFLAAADEPPAGAVAPEKKQPTHVEMGADIATKIDGMILARLNTDKIIDAESVNVLTKLNQISLSRRM